ncbi:MAG: alpha-galactosidase [Allobaculum sp.]|nr:alpha-galactosidase [Allobaculum sp.]
MAIVVQNHIFSLYTKDSLYQMKVDAFGILNHTWYGPKTDMDMSYLEDYPEIGFSGNLWESLDNRLYSLNDRPLEYPSFISDFRLSAIEVQFQNGSTILDLRYKDYRLYSGKYTFQTLPTAFVQDSKDLNSSLTDEVQTLEIHLEDSLQHLEVILLYGVFPEINVITRALKIINHGLQSVILKRVCSVALDFPYGDFDLLHFHGRHAMERLFERVPLGHHTFRIESTRGHSSHQHNPTIILAPSYTTETQGEAYGAALMYSGNFQIEVQKDQLDQIRLVMGLDRFSWSLEADETFEAPEVLLSFSNTGLTKLTHQFHDLFRHHILPQNFVEKKRPILLNNWEATYFNFDGQTLLHLAKEAKELGIELFVLDDGWFGKRNDDTTSLGDWVANEEKLGMSLANLSHSIHKLGLQFGLWIEPEMISIESNLYRTHPQWVLQAPHRFPTTSRSQLVLDLSNPNVVDYLERQISQIIEDNDIDYIKWDMNRSISDCYSQAWSSDQQGEVAHRYILGVYELSKRLTRKFPHVLFEGCAGGGGRFDPAMLYYFPQIWCSDNTDAHCRTFIQYGTSFFYPLSTMGSHVSAIPNHQTGRNTPLKTREVVATPGSFGYELDITQLSPTEKEEIIKQIIRFQTRQDLILKGDYFRLSPPTTGLVAWQIADSKRETILVQGVRFETKPNEKRPRIILQDLDPSAFYRRQSDQKVFSALTLMHGGILLDLPQGTDIAYEEIFSKI